MAASEPESPEADGLEQGLFSHLIELRTRLMQVR